MKRTPVTIPLPCYGLEHRASAPVCRACPHEPACEKAMGRRADRVTLARVTFALVPESIDSANGAAFAFEGPDDDADESYAECFERVFGERPPRGRRYFTPAQAATVRANAREAKCSFKTFMSAAMLAFQASNPKGTFYAKNLLSERPVARIETYREAVKNMHGNFDAETMENFLFGEETESLEKRMLHSEILAGEWIVAYKLKNAGSPFKAFYVAKELVLDPLWLCIEPSYRETVFNAYLRDPDGTDADRRRWRHTVGQTMKKLKTSGRNRWGRARYLFRCREAVAPKAIERVLSYYGLRTSDLEIEGVAVTDMMRLWSRVGLAIQHWLCLRWKDGDDGAERLLRR